MCAIMDKTIYIAYNQHTYKDAKDKGKDEKEKGKDATEKGMLFMNIIVCVKQTPEAGRGEMDPKRGTVRRKEGRQMINPFDLYAMEAALRLQEEKPDTRIIALSMGPAPAASVLRDCIALGAETGYLVCDPEFAGSDVRGTAQVLAQAVRAIEKREGIRADAIFCGAKTVDGGTGMLGPELAQFLHLPQVTYALHCSPLEEGGLRVEKEDDRGNRIYSIPAPCLITFTKASFEVRYPMIARILEAESMELPVLSAKDLAAESDDGAEAESAAGLSFAGAGRAAAQISEVHLRKLEKQSQIIEEADPVKAVTALAQRLYSEGIL